MINTTIRLIEAYWYQTKSDKKAVYVEESNEKSTRFSVGDHVRISNFKNIFAKRYTPNVWRCIHTHTHTHTYIYKHNMNNEQN